MKLTKTREVEPRLAEQSVSPIAPAPRLLQPGRTRRPAVFVLMALTIAVGALGAYFLVQASSERTAVVGLANDVAWGQTVEASDLVAVEIVTDPALQPVSWDARGQIVGHLAATDLQAGTLLTTRSVTTGDEIPGAGQTLVGVLVKAGQLPVTPLGARDKVQLIITGQVASGVAAAGNAPSGVVDAEVFTVGGIDANGTRTVDVLVPTESSQQVAVAAAAGTVSIVLAAKG